MGRWLSQEECLLHKHEYLNLNFKDLDGGGGGGIQHWGPGEQRE